MSYAFNLWTREKIDQVDSKYTSTYILTADYNTPVQKDDVPESIYNYNKKINFLSTISVHNEALRKEEIQKLTVLFEDIAAGAGGILEDPQKEYFEESPSIDSAKQALTSAEKKTPTTSMSVVFYIDPQRNLSTLYPQMIDLIEKHLPSALPRRYGASEPAKYHFEKTGRAHLIEFLQTTDAVVWVPSKPYMHLFLSNAHAYPPVKMGFRCNRIELVFRSNAYLKASFQKMLHAWIKDMSLLFKPFYGEIIPTERIFTTSWWWRGLPTHWGDFAILGPGYAQEVKMNFNLDAHNVSIERWSEDLIYSPDAALMAWLKKSKPQWFAHKKRLSHFKKTPLNSLIDYRYARVFPFKKP